MVNHKLANGNIEIEPIPLNSFGGTVPWKKVSCNYVVESGNATIIKQDSVNGIVVIKPDTNRGEISILAKSNYSLWTNRITIPLNNPEES